MQHEEIIGLMKETIPYSEKSLSGLSDLITEYPYFQTAHLLHTLNLLHLKDAHFLSDLRKAAVYVPDRKQLFFRVENDYFEPEPVETPESEILVPDDLPLELNEAVIPESVEATSPQYIEPRLPQFSTTDYVSYFLSNETENEEVPPLQHQETIDKFLEKDAVSSLKIKLNRTDESLEELPEPAPEPPIVDGFFTETLAKIFIKQKKYDKALEIIRKLNLIYPEKSRYFADRIRFLEQLIIYTSKK